MAEYTQEFVHRLFFEMNEAEGILAEALGYPYDEYYGFATGEHTLVTLAEEAARKLKERGGEMDV